MEGQQKALAAGIVQTAAGAPVMALDLAAADPSFVSRTPAGFIIREVATEAELGDFKQVFVSTYQIPDWAGQAWVDATLGFGIGHSPWRMFVGYLAGEAVATNMLFNGGGVASVYAVATTPKAQGRGIGAAITLHPLLLARDEGYRHAALFSTEQGYPVYRRLGFVDTGVRINRYLWRAP
jgi:GNAT superfamily N-acetyltransferase